jgi:hypothetical protein
VSKKYFRAVGQQVASWGGDIQVWREHLRHNVGQWAWAACYQGWQDQYTGDQAARRRAGLKQQGVRR